MESRVHLRVCKANGQLKERGDSMDKKIALELGAIFLLILSAAVWLAGVQGLLKLHSADEYEDKGVLQFIPKHVYPSPRKNRSGIPRDQRNNPIKTVYVLEYASSDGYKIEVEYSTKSPAQKVLREKKALSQRVLALKENGRYITVDPEHTAESYAASQRRKYLVATLLSTLYIVGFFAVLILQYVRGHRLPYDPMQ